jgi:hypothetical protein
MSKRYQLLLSIVLLLFLLLYIMLCFYSRLATDDYYFIDDVRSHGIINGVASQYMQWSGRFAAIFFMDVFYKYLDVRQTYYFLLPLSSLILIISGIYYLLSSLFKKYNIVNSSSQKLLFASSFSALLFFLSFDIAESWFWYCGLSPYLWSVIAFIWGIVFLIETKRFFLSTAASVLCFIYVGGSSEVYSVIIGIPLILLLIYNFKKSKYLSTFFTSDFNKKLFITLSALAISFIILLIAPGNYLRATQFPAPTTINCIIVITRMFGKLFFWFLPQKAIYIFIFSIPFLIFGKSIQKDNSISSKIFLKKIRTITLLLLLLIFIVFTIIAITTSQSGEYRVWFILSFLLTIYFICIAFFAGYNGLVNDKKIQFLKRTSIIVGIVMMGFNLINQYKITKQYSLAVDNRVSFLLNMNTRLSKDTLIIVPKLPPSGMLYSAEITADTNHFTNIELRLGYNLKYHVAIENKEH